MRSPARNRIIGAARLILLALLLLPAPGWNAAADARQDNDGYVEIIPLGGLDFGTASQNAGHVYVHRTDAYVGKYKVRAKFMGGPPTVTISLFPPHSLAGPKGGAIPYYMQASFNATADDAASATDISGTSAQVTLMMHDGYEGSEPVYAGFVYVYGAVSVGYVPVGNYLGMATLQAEAEVSHNPCAAPTWSRFVRYFEGDVVTHEGGAWMADRMTRGNEPGKAHDWDPDSGKGKGRPWNLLAVCD